MNKREMKHVGDARVIIGDLMVHVFFERKLALNGKPRELSVSFFREDMTFDRMLVTTRWDGVRWVFEPTDHNRLMLWTGIIDEARIKAAEALEA